jgi:hypothetical protein
MRHSHVLCIELAHFLLTDYSMDVADPLRGQVVTEARLGDSLRAFDTLLGDLVTSLSMSANFHGGPICLNTLRRCSPVFSSIEVSAEGSVITQPKGRSQRAYCL